MDDSSTPLSADLPDGAFAGQRVFGRIHCDDPEFLSRITSPITWIIRDHEDLSIVYHNGPMPDEGIVLDDPIKYSIVIEAYFLADDGRYLPVVEPGTGMWLRAVG